MTFSNYFDGVIMLTWSDWKTEPRSNRYHYATRFARLVPVLFIQPWAVAGSPLVVEATEIENLDIVRAPSPFNIAQVDQLRELLHSRGIKRPLVWIYNSLHFQTLIDEFSRYFKVYHATEDYFTASAGIALSDAITIQDSIRGLLPSVDLLVSVSSGVLKSYRDSTNFSAECVLLENGCDAQFLMECAREAGVDSKIQAESKVAIFQGGINQRLDYQLLIRTVRALPDWEFRFCGKAVDTTGWRQLLSHNNVRYIGNLNPVQIAHEMARASVGIIPFIQDQWIKNSLPLKAYEYIACGLPVVSIPIDSLSNSAELFSFASTSEEFIEEIQAAHAKRHVPDLLLAREAAARRNSYDARFADLLTVLSRQHEKLLQKPSRLNVVILFDPGSTHVGTIREHLEAFTRYSRNDIIFVPCTNPHVFSPNVNQLSAIDLSIFDVAIIHYSVRLSISMHLNECVETGLRDFNGFKVLFIQDEYENTEIARSYIDRIKFDIVYTCVPKSGLEHVYPAYRFPGTEFLPTLTGYVPEDAGIERFARPVSERKTLVGYRGRKLPTVYGRLGYEKYQIGVVVKATAEELGLLVDIEVEDSKRIYKEGWYAFLGSVRATLGTESGANIFDFDGSLKKQIAELESRNPGIAFNEISENFLSQHEGIVVMNQISPKIFEAIRLRTALVLFEGQYSGVVLPNIHFLPLKKDFSNLREIFEKLRDDALIDAMTKRAYTDIVESCKYSYRLFVEGVDIDLSKRVLHARKRKLLVGSVYSLESDGSLKLVLPLLPLSLVAGASPFDHKPAASELAKRLNDLISIQVPGPLDRWIFGAEETHKESPKTNPGRNLPWAQHRVPTQRRNGKLIGFAQSLLLQSQAQSHGNTLSFRIARRAWYLLPKVARVRLERLIGRH